MSTSSFCIALARQTAIRDRLSSNVRPWDHNSTKE